MLSFIKEYSFFQLTSKIALSQKEIFKTIGGSYVKKITDTDAQVLALIAPQIKPLPNPYDDAASYFGLHFLLLTLLITLLLHWKSP